mmetsp:Transcript_73782/g.130065  ORF Transcript_73782/g.130065 Transcript_73782/m.130065 type:complete len:241 (+) Transcript_73782:403-1125(+)
MNGSSALKHKLERCARSSVTSWTLKQRGQGQAKAPRLLNSQPPQRQMSPKHPFRTSRRKPPVQCGLSQRPPAASWWLLMTKDLLQSVQQLRHAPQPHPKELTRHQPLQWTLQLKHPADLKVLSVPARQSRQQRPQPCQTPSSTKPKPRRRRVQPLAPDALARLREGCQTVKRKTAPLQPRARNKTSPMTVGARKSRWTPKSVLLKRRSRSKATPSPAEGAHQKSPGLQQQNEQKGQVTRR